MNRDFSFGQKNYTYVDKLAEKFRYGKIISFLENKVTKISDLIFCDVGCGFNANLLMYLKVHYLINRPFGIDLDINPGITDSVNFIKSDLEKADFNIENDKVDIVTSIVVIEHLYNSDMYLKEIFRILKPGGYFILTTPHSSSKPVLEFLANIGLSTKEEIMDHKIYYNVNTLKKCLDNFKYSDIFMERFTFRFNIFCGCKK